MDLIGVATRLADRARKAEIQAICDTQLVYRDQANVRYSLTALAKTTLTRGSHTRLLI